MTHPRTFLTEGRPLQPGQWEKLGSQCSASRQGPGPDEITFTFHASDIRDHPGRTIVANRLNGSFRCLPQPQCICLQEPLDCECNETTCSGCGQKLTAQTNVCDLEFCVNEQCPLCEHQRETCMYQEVRESVREDAARSIRQRRENIAAAHVGAVGSVLAPGVGEAPLFPVTMRVLDELLGGHHDVEEFRRTQGAVLEWSCPDGSRVKHNPHSPGWLTWDDPDGGQLEEAA